MILLSVATFVFNYTKHGKSKYKLIRLIGGGKLSGSGLNYGLLNCEGNQITANL